MKIHRIIKKNSQYGTQKEYKGRIIVIEGNDGAGKSTIVKYLHKYLTSIGKRSIIVKFNMSYITLAAIKKGKKKYFGPYTNTLLHTVSIVDQFERYVFAKLRRGSIIICDRYLYSILARGIVRGVPENIISDLSKWIITPDVSFYIDISPMVALERRNIDTVTFWEAGEDVLFNKDRKENFLEFQTKIRNVFLDNAKKWNFVVMDGEKSTQDMISEIVSYLVCKNIIAK